MASLGELFIELGVVGDTKELDKTLNTMKETIKAVDKQIQQSQRLRRYREELAKATTKGEKDAIKKEFALDTKKRKLLEQKDALEKNKDANVALANKIAGVVKGITAFVTAVSLAVTAVNKLTNQLVESNQVFLNLTRTSDISLNTFQKWDSVGKMLGVQNAAQQLEGLNERLFDLMLTGQGARGFQLAGINPMGQDVEGVLEQIRNRISGLSDTSASYLLKEMGLDPQMLHLLRMSRDEFEALNAEMAKYRLTPEQRASIQQMNIQLQIASQKLQYLKDRAILAIMPAWTRFVENITYLIEILAKAGAAVGRFVKKWGLLIGGLYLGVSRIPRVAKVLKGLSVGLRNNQAAMLRLMRTIPVFGRTIAALAATIMRSFLPVTAILAGLYLLLDDLMVYKEGGNSVIGLITKGLEDLDIKGFIDFPVPQWLEYLIEVIHFYQSGGFDNGIDPEKLYTDSLKESFNDIPKEIKKDKDKAETIELLKRINRINNSLFMDFDKKNEEIYKLINPQEAERFINNFDNRSINTNSGNIITQHINIETQQPANEINERLRFVQHAFGK